MCFTSSCHTVIQKSKAFQRRFSQQINAFFQRKDDHKVPEEKNAIFITEVFINIQPFSQLSDQIQEGLFLVQILVFYSYANVSTTTGKEKEGWLNFQNCLYITAILYHIATRIQNQQTSAYSQYWNCQHMKQQSLGLSHHFTQEGREPVNGSDAPVPVEKRSMSKKNLTSSK